MLMSGMVLAVDTTVDTPTAAAVTIQGFIGVTLSWTGDFGVMTPNTDKQQTLTIAIGPESNIGGVTLSTKANSGNFVGASNPTGHIFGVSNMGWTNIGEAVGHATPYTTTSVIMNPNVKVFRGQSASITHDLHVPAEQIADGYSVGITITATGENTA